MVRSVRNSKPRSPNDVLVGQSMSCASMHAAAANRSRLTGEHAYDSRLQSENRGREQTEVRSTFDLSARIAAYATPTQRVHALRSQNALPCRSRLHKTSAASSPISTALSRILRPVFIALLWRLVARRECPMYPGSFFAMSRARCAPAAPRWRSLGRLSHSASSRRTAHRNWQPPLCVRRSTHKMNQTMPHPIAVSGGSSCRKSLAEGRCSPSSAWPSVSTAGRSRETTQRFSGR